MEGDFAKRDLVCLFVVSVVGDEERWNIVEGVAPKEFGAKEGWDVGGSLVKVPRKSGGGSRSWWPAWTVSTSWTLGIEGVKTGWRAHQAWAAAASSYDAFVVEL